MVQVCFAGACYTNGQVVNSGQKRPHIMGIMDTSLFPGTQTLRCLAFSPLCRFGPWLVCPLILDVSPPLNTGNLTSRFIRNNCL